jgi:hypothetical protein
VNEISLRRKIARREYKSEKRRAGLFDSGTLIKLSTRTYAAD